MLEDKNGISSILDTMALKILIVEPGDLSVVGELLGSVEELLVFGGETEQQRWLHGMAVAFKAVMDGMIMGELADSAENYELLSKAVIQMQEVVRTGANLDPTIISTFVKHINETGYPLTVSTLLGAVEREGTSPGVSSEEKPGEPGPDELAPALASTGNPEDSPGGSPGGGSLGVPDFLQDRELLGGFIDEASEHLASIEVNILELEQNPGNPDIINNIFRPFHTVKGVSGFLNLTTINNLAHATENLLDDVRSGKRSMDSGVIDLVLVVGDTLREMVENIRDVLEIGPERYREFDISAQVAQLQALRATGESLGSLTPVAMTEESIGENTERNMQDDEPPKSLADRAIASEVAATSPSSTSMAVAKGTPLPPVADQQTVARKTIEASIKVDVGKLDALINAMGELVIMQALVRQNPLVVKMADPKLAKDFSQLRRIISDLQHTVMSMRMVPIKQTFDKMMRLARDLSKKTGKKVDLVMEGAETEIDRNMVDSIYDPLVHMVRNSVDHGIGTPEERTKRGKPPTGVIHLRAYQKGGGMVIEIADDGEGLNTVKIREKAATRGLIRPGDSLPDFQLNNLIFMPGFSTADQVSDVSGRGVGMDVVKKAVEKLRGQVEVHSQPGAGCLFVIYLPLTLAIIDGIIVRVGSERYIIPTTAIWKSLKPEPKSYNTVHGRGESLLIRGSLVPIVRLYRLFDVEPTFTDPCEAIMVMVESEGRRCALMVDELLGKEEVVIKNLGGMLAVPGVAGGTILGDGRVGLILDLAGIISSVAE